MEIDGKSENYERPVVVLKVYNKESLLVLPLTTKVKTDQFHHEITTEKRNVSAKLTQSRVISSKRLMRRIETLSDSEFRKLKREFIDSI